MSNPYSIAEKFENDENSTRRIKMNKKNQQATDDRPTGKKLNQPKRVPKW